MTIVEAIKQVMREAKRPLTAREALTAIVEKSLYEFHAEDPLHVVAMQIRRHCAGLEFPSAAPTKHFQILGDDRYSPLPSVLRGPPSSRRRTPPGTSDRAVEPSAANPLTDVEKQLWGLHAKYLELFEEHMLRELKRLSPAGFEAFARDLLAAYGFTETVVTSISRDGGIDGHGKLKVGVAHLNVAFQCKRWTNGNIQRPEIDKFRGASQGAYEQGILFYNHVVFQRSYRGFDPAWGDPRRPDRRRCYRQPDGREEVSRRVEHHGHPCVRPLTPRAARYWEAPACMDFASSTNRSSSRRLTK